MKARAIQTSLLALAAALGLAVMVSYFVNPYVWFPFSTAGPSESDQNWILSQMPERKPFADYSRAMSRSKLFRYTVREEPPKKQRNVIEDYILLGTAVTPSGNRANLRNTITNQNQTLGPGDEIGDYRIIEITRDHVSFSKGDEVFEMIR